MSVITNTYSTRPQFLLRCYQRIEDFKDRTIACIAGVPHVWLVGGEAVSSWITWSSPWKNICVKSKILAVP